MEPDNLDIQAKQRGDEMADVRAAVLAQAMHEEQARDGRGGGGVHPDCDVIHVVVADGRAGLDLEVEEGAHAAVGEKGGASDGGGGERVGG
jgi:hypothetical protein